MILGELTTYAVIFLSVVTCFIIVHMIINLIQGKKTEGNGARSVSRHSPVQHCNASSTHARRRLIRQRMRVRHEESDEDEDGRAAIGDTSPLSQGKIGTKKMKKLQEKAERRATRETMEGERQAYKQREREAEILNKKNDEQEQKDRALQEIKERHDREQRECQEYDEYVKMKDKFSVVDEGEEELETDWTTETLLSDFIMHIKQKKVVMLDELAARFMLKTQDVIDRIQSLQSSGDLTGVIDDRGKFIYITVEELHSVAKYVNQHGRISKADLAASSNRLIKLT